MTLEELQAEVDRLTRSNADLTKKNEGLAASVVDLNDVLKETRGEAKERRLENRTLAQQLAELTTERDSFKQRAEAEPGELQKRLDEATGKIRERDHKDAFNKVAKGMKVSDPTAQADLWALSGYKPEGDAPDESRIKEAIGATLKGRPRFLDAEPDGSTTAAGAANGGTQTTPAKPGPGADRGQSLSQSPSQAPARPAGRL
jgi:hypothetical protein